MTEISFQNGLMMSMSIPKLKSKKDKGEKNKPKDLFSVLGKQQKKKS